MTPRGPRAVTCAVSVAFALLSAGCPKRQSTMDRPPEINPPPPVEQNAAVRVDELGGLAQRFAQTANRLPGRNAGEHISLVQQAFTDLAEILPILYGPNPSGPQRQQLRVIESARAQLGAGRQGLAPEPTIGTGLRAARDALDALSRGNYFDQPDVAKTIDQLNGTVADLDAARGSNHQQVVAETIDLMSQAVTQMAAALDERLQGGDGAAQQQPAQCGVWRQ